MFRQIIRFCLAAVIAITGCSVALAQNAPVGQGGGKISGPKDDVSHHMQIAREKALASARKLNLLAEETSGAKGVISPIDRTNLQRLQFPVQLSPASETRHGHGISNFVDLNDAGPDQKLDYFCTERTYDLASGYDHQGIDIFTWPYPWLRMDASDQYIIAAASGTIVVREDGHFDKNCSFNPVDETPNYIAIQQDDGLFAYYLHMKNGSLTSKLVGARVDAGEVLGQIGSSGVSTGPHLHFELQDSLGRVVDPNAGACGASETLWQHQSPYREPLVLQIGISSSEPNLPGGSCLAGTTNFARRIEQGASFYVSTYLKDQEAGKTAKFEIYQPNGTKWSEAFSGSPGAGVDAWSSSWWYFNWIMGTGVTGEWTVRIIYDGKSYDHPFWVGENAPPSANSLVSAVLPASRSVQAGTPATVFTTVINSGDNPAYGCHLAADVPLAGDFTFQTTDPLTNALTGSPNENVVIAGGGSQSFLVAIDVDSGETATSLEVPVRMDCENSSATSLVSGVNSFTLSFEPDPVPDVITLAVTTSNNGILSIPGAGGAGAFSIATSNVGTAASLTIAPRSTTAGTMPMSICETDPNTAACIGSAAASLTRSFGATENATFAVFVTATDPVTFDPGNARIFVDITDSNDVLRGATSIAVRTDE